MLQDAYIFLSHRLPKLWHAHVNLFVHLASHYSPSREPVVTDVKITENAHVAHAVGQGPCNKHLNSTYAYPGSN